ncbi:YbbR-like domain-containing protein [Atopococcus tabaci]|uniref:CdaR family protein n=1 Tax=Atopococcus tabaci TaxID=269774 RepID=UPI00040F702A|nr:CdaR family protein [Atopococcus tabaci]
MKGSSNKSPWPSRLLSLLFAVLLFSFVHYENNSRVQSTTPSNGASITSVEVLTDIPIGINIDKDRYFVSGIPETATVRLEGPQAILTQTLATRNFEIVTPDLDDLGPGTHVIRLGAEGISNQLDYSIMPSEFPVVIEEKVTKEFDINVEFDTAYLEDGYEAGTPQLSQDTVVISGAASTVEQVNQVAVVVVPEEGNITEDIEATLSILVFDASGELLNVNIEPSQVDVYIPVEGTQKSLPVALRQTGTADPNYEYTLELEQGENESVLVTGEQNLLEDMGNFVVEVDVSGVTESTLRTVPLPVPDGITEVMPEELDVVIRVSPKNDGEANNDESDETNSSEENAEDTSGSQSNTANTADEEPSDTTENDTTTNSSVENDSAENGVGSNQQPDSSSENDQ